MTASDTITRVALLGGSWNDIGINGFENLLTDESGVIYSFERFTEGVEWLIREYPYIFYDTLRDHLITVTNNPDHASDDFDLRMLRMVVPTLETLKRWYAEECEALVSEELKASTGYDDLTHFARCLKRTN